MMCGWNITECVSEVVEGAKKALDAVISPIDTAKEALGNTAESIFTAALKSVAKTFASAYAEILGFILEKLIAYKSVNNSESDRLPSAFLENVSSNIKGVSVVIAITGFSWQCVRLIIQRKADPAVNLAKGLWNYLLWMVAGVTIITTFVTLSDALAKHFVGLIKESVEGSLKEVITKPTSLTGDNDKATLIGILLIGSIVALLAALIISVLLIFQEAAILLLLCFLPIAASGVFLKATSGWMKKLLSYVTSLLAFKPTVALIFYICFALYGSVLNIDESAGLFEQIHYILVISVIPIICIIAFPVLTKFFDFAIDKVEASGSMDIGRGPSSPSIPGRPDSSPSNSPSTSPNNPVEMSQFMSQNGPGSASSAAQSGGAASKAGGSAAGGAGGGAGGGAAGGAGSAGGGAAAAGGTAAAGVATGGAALAAVAAQQGGEKVKQSVSQTAEGTKGSGQ